MAYTLVYVDFFLYLCGRFVKLRNLRFKDSKFRYIHEKTISAGYCGIDNGLD